MAQHMSTHGQLATLEEIPESVWEEGPLFPLGRVEIESDAWELIPSGYLTRAIELHHCGVFGDIEEYEVRNNLENSKRFNRFILGEVLYTGCIYSRWNPPGYRQFMVFSVAKPELNTYVSAA